MVAGIKGGWCAELQTYRLYVPILWKSGIPNVMEISGPVQGLYRDCFTFNFTIGLRIIIVFPGCFGPEVESPVHIGQGPGLTLPFLFQYMR
jgi:hypothetical protein